MLNVDGPSFVVSVQYQAAVQRLRLESRRVFDSSSQATQMVTDWQQLVSRQLAHASIVAAKRCVETRPGAAEPSLRLGTGPGLNYGGLARDSTG